MKSFIEVRRKKDSWREDAGAIYALKFSNFCEKTENFAGCVVFKLDNGCSWNFEVLTQYFYETLESALERDDLEIIKEE